MPRYTLPPGPGRPKGSKTKQQLAVEAKQEQLGCDPITAMATLAMDENTPLDLQIKLYCELAQYVVPRRKAVEQPIAIELPTLASSKDAVTASAAIVAPPSIHPNGQRYAWLPGHGPSEIGVAEAPAWLLDLLDPPRPPAPPRPARADLSNADDAYVQAAIEGELERVANAPVGRRNDTLYLAALALGRFVAAGRLDARDVGPLLVGAAMGAGLSRAEAERTVTSGFGARILGGAP